VPRTSADDSLKDPYVFEFLGIQVRKDYSETELEGALMGSFRHTAWGGCHVSG